MGRLIGRNVVDGCWPKAGVNVRMADAGRSIGHSPRRTSDWRRYLQSRANALRAEEDSRVRTVELGAEKSS
jgi:hypothetical protein